MKKLFTFITIVGLSASASAQGIEIYLPGEDDELSGTVYNIDSEESSPHQEFDVKNVSGETLTLRVERVKIIELEGTEDYLCWGATPETGACYSAALVAPYNPFITPDESDLPDGDRGWLSTYHVTNNVSGCAQYRYYVIDGEGTRLDSIDVHYCSTVGIEEELALDISVYPNPASDWVNISLEDNVAGLNFTLYNVLGDAVLSSQLIKGQNTVNVEDLPNGVYFYAVIRDGKAVETKKLVIRH